MAEYGIEPVRDNTRYYRFSVSNWTLEDAVKACEYHSERWGKWRVIGNFGQGWEPIEFSVRSRNE